MGEEDHPHIIATQDNAGLKMQQRRALISRDVLKSDQPCLLVTECTMVVEEEMAEGDS
jgi:hypothetical protein